MTDRLTELRFRVEARQKQLEADLARAKADAAGLANDHMETMQRKLDELQGALKDGWEKVSEGTLKKLNEWLK